MGDHGLSQAGTTLLASSLRMPILRGTHRCFYCASSCDAQFRASQYVRHSFTARDTVAGGEFVCSGCVASLNEKATVMLPDGTIRTRQKMRNYSWLLTPDRAIAATKSHRGWLLDQCLQPPDPPFVISISDSGQKQLLYRSRISHSRDPITVTLEGEVIAVAPAVLADRVWTGKQIAAVLGRPALSGLPTCYQQMKLIESYAGGDGELLLRHWLSVRENAVSRLAAWFVPKMEDCKRECLDKIGSAAGGVDD